MESEKQMKIEQLQNLLEQQPWLDFVEGASIVAGKDLVTEIMEERLIDHVADVSSDIEAGI